MARPIEKREHIERGVLEVVARKGLRGTTIQDISNAASVSPGLLYRYWRNRDELAADVYRKQLADLLGHLQGLAPSDAGVAQRLRAIVAAFLRLADEEPVLLRFLLLSQHDLAHGLPDEESVRTFVLTLIEQGMAEGVVRQMDPDLAVQLLIGIVLQPAVGVIYGHLVPPVSKHFEEIFATLERALFVPSRGLTES